MEQIFVKCELKSEDDLNDHLFSVEEIKVRGINVQLTCYANPRCYRYVFFSNKLCYLDEIFHISRHVSKIMSLNHINRVQPPILILGYNHQYSTTPTKSVRHRSIFQDSKHALVTALCFQIIG